MNCSCVSIIAIIIVLFVGTFSEKATCQAKNVLVKGQDIPARKTNENSVMLVPYDNDKLLGGKFKYRYGNLYSDKLIGTYNLEITRYYSEKQKRFGITIKPSFRGISIYDADTINFKLDDAGILNKNFLDLSGNCFNVSGGQFWNSTLSISSRSGTYAVCSFTKCLLEDFAENLTFNNCEIDGMKLLIFDHLAKGTSIQFVNCVFKSDIEIGITDTILFYSVESYRSITLTKARLNKPKLRYIYLNRTDLNILNFPDYDIRFIVSTDQPYASQVRLYKQLVAHYADIKDEKRVYDIQLQKLVNKHENRWLVNWVEEHWSNYGYDKNLIFRNSLYLMLFFFLMNLFVFRYPRILYNGYRIVEFITADQRITDKYPQRWQYQIVKMVLCMVYTGYIFWGVKLSVDKIKLSNLTVTLWIITQYVTGIICLAYIANVIITKV